MHTNVAWTLVIVVSFLSLPLRSQTYTDLHDFVCSTDGCGPANAVLVQGRDGNIYGTTGYGGTYNYGTIFKITPSGTFSVIYSFSSQTVAWSPQAGVSLGLDGNLYGTTMFGGPTNAGTLFSSTPSGAVTILYNFDLFSGQGYRPSVPLILGADGNFYGLAHSTVGFSITPAGSYSALTTSLPASPDWAGLVQAKNGNFYSTTYDGGTNASGTIFQMSSSGVVKVIYNFDTVHGGWGYAPLVEDAQGVMYGTENQGGSFGGGVVFKTTTAGKLTVLHNFIHQDPTGGWNVAAGVVLGNDGNLYGSTEAGGASGVGVLYKLSRSGSYQQLYSFDGPHGAWPTATAMQHTNGKLYGWASGGANSTYVIWSFDAGLKPFVALVLRQGQVGQTVQILGNGLTGTTKVKFGTASASFSVVSDTFMTSVVPSTATTSKISVITPSRALISNMPFRVLPAITSYAPTSGPVGSQVVITGTGLVQLKKITFNGVTATFTSNSATQVTATVPLGATTGKISITTLGGAATGPGTFTVN